ncbi:hypothetical protein AMD02_012720 [Halalkalibacterium halodurans]|jgi:DnaJ-class molecular chaperone|uniref:Uncharacterized protein n=1 Tax=Halalkalibacterium halodurans TaxID=86665 RepID=A0A0M0KHI0_ALKHA|nr:hypothetical protein AMD02_012720 [Halalkalibacterium halodurans]
MFICIENSDNINEMIARGRTLVRKREQTKTTSCPYCKGRGYFQLILGGTETCDYCSGAGTLQEVKPESIVS